MPVGQGARIARMIQISDSAQAHFRKLIEREALPGLGVRLSAVHPGTAQADARLCRRFEQGDVGQWIALHRHDVGIAARLDDAHGTKENSAKFLEFLHR